MRWRIGRRWTSAVLVACTLGTMSIGRAAAEATAPAAEESSPSPALLVGGLVLAVGGGALQYYGIRRFTEGLDSSDGGSVSVGWALLAQVGSLATLAGGAVTTAWGWKLGEFELAGDLTAGLPPRETRSLGFVGLGVGLAGALGIVGGQLYVTSKAISCGVSAGGSGGGGTVAFNRCAKDVIFDVTIVQLAGSGVLLAAAGVVGYAFGYDSAANRTSSRHGPFEASLSPVYLPTLRGNAATGLALTGRF